MTEVRRAKPGDESHWSRAVQDLLLQEDRHGPPLSPEAVTEMLQDDRCYLYLAFVSEEPIGLLSAFRFPDVEREGKLVYLYDIEVAAGHRRRGIGSSLVSALVNQCRRDGVTGVWAGTDALNTPARRTFEATGAELGGETYVEYQWDLAAP